MKKLLLLCFVALMSVAANAQFYVGGTLGFDYDKVKVEGAGSESTTSFLLNPEFGYNFDNILAVGATVGFGYGDNDSFDLTQYEVSPYIRATFANVKNVSFFAEGALFINRTELSYDGDDDDFGFNTWGAAVRPGFKVAMSDKLHIIARATLLQYSKAEKHDVDVKEFKFGIPNNFTVGVMFNF